MKVLMILAMLGFGIYWAVAEDDSFVKASVLDRLYGDRPEDQRYLEGRLNVSENGREIDVVAFIRLRAWDDCAELSKQMMDDIASDCPQCEFKLKECTSKLSSRYSNLFENKPARTPYLSYDAADATERDIRMITWGLNQQQAKGACGMLVKMFVEFTKNQPVCVAPG